MTAEEGERMHMSVRERERECVRERASVGVSLWPGQPALLTTLCCNSEALSVETPCLCLMAGGAAAPLAANTTQHNGAP